MLRVFPSPVVLLVASVACAYADSSPLPRVTAHPSQEWQFTRPPQEAREFIRSVDTDKDGRVSMEEFLAYMKQVRPR